MKKKQMNKREVEEKETGRGGVRGKKKGERAGK